MFFDLDGTVIFSPRRIESPPSGLVLVEKHPSAYMTRKAYQGLRELIRQDVFIPVTMRSRHQYRRLSFSRLPKHTVLYTGTEIYHKGHLDREWNSHLQEQVGAAPSDVFTSLATQMQGDVISVRDVTWRAKFYDSASASRFKDAVSVYIEGDWRLHQEKRRVFLLNTQVSKQNAVLYLHEKYGIPLSFAAGDSLADVPMIRLTDDGMSPLGSKVYQHSQNQDIPSTSRGHEFAGEEIIEMALLLSR